MRLLNATTKNLEEHDEPQQYAILSHRWREDEVTFADFALNKVSNRKGFDKLSKACDAARSRNFQYLWMDTCCIDKSSSAELSEAINSMYKYYKVSGTCIAYLDDIETTWKDMFRYSVWFSRGWTLHELIAPGEVIFYEKTWVAIGTKGTLAPDIKAATNIDEEVLLTGNLAGISVAKKMSWAAKRQTTRLEDQAYSLLGIFGVNMPTLYGEGSKAFIRLQEEIVKQSSDQSVFAWGSHIRCRRFTANPTKDNVRNYQVVSNDLLDGNIGLLAPEPSKFDQASNIVAMSPDRLAHSLRIQGLLSEFTVTNYGIRIQLPVQLIDSGRKVYVAFLRCGDHDSNIFAIYLRLLSGSKYMRIPGHHGRPDLLNLPLSDIIRSNILVNDYIHVQAHIPAVEPEARVLIAVVNIHDLLEFCKQWDFTVTVLGDTDNNGLLTLNTDAEPSSCKLELTLVIERKTVATSLKVLVKMALSKAHANRNQKHCISVSAHIVGDGEDGSGQLRWSTDEDDKHTGGETQKDPPIALSASVTLGDEGGMMFTLACMREPRWKKSDGPISGMWGLSANTLSRLDNTDEREK